MDNHKESLNLGKLSSFFSTMDELTNIDLTVHGDAIGKIMFTVQRFGHSELSFLLVLEEGFVEESSLLYFSREEGTLRDISEEEFFKGIKYLNN
jgi:hypothetical protein